MEFFTCSSGNGCNPLSEANANTDTVKVVVQPEHEKENAIPNQQPHNVETKDVRKEDERLTSQLANAKAASENVRVVPYLALGGPVAGIAPVRKYAERERAEEQATKEAHWLLTGEELRSTEEGELAAERRRQEEVERAAAEEATERQREEERLQAQQEAQEERERREREDHKRKEAEAKCKKEELDRAQRKAEQKSIELEKVKQFLSQHGYLGVNTKRTKMMKSKYPLHTAVKLADQEMILLLLSSGADQSLKNSSGETPEQLARKLNKSGSHDRVSSALQGLAHNVS